MALGAEPEKPLPYPIIADDKRQLSHQLGMLDPDELDKDGIPLTARCVRPAEAALFPSRAPRLRCVRVWGVLTCPTSGVCDRPRQEAEAVHPLPCDHRTQLRRAAPCHRLPAAHCAEEGRHTRWLEGTFTQFNDAQHGTCGAHIVVIITSLQGLD